MKFPIIHLAVTTPAAILLTAMTCLSACHNTPGTRTSQADIDTIVPDSIPAPPTIPGAKTILFFGNSLTAGYGVGADQSFPAIIGRRIDSLHWPYQVINAGISGETTADGKSRIGWTLRQHVDIFVLELGANDGLRGIPVAGTATNLQAIIDSVKTKYPAAKIVLAGMQVPPSMGLTYANAFRQIFGQLAAKNKVALIPFLLQDVAGISELNQPDGIHPSEQGHRIVADNVWQVLHPLLQ
jgi:acyl-CoA thioesterase-1